MTTAAPSPSPLTVRLVPILACLLVARAASAADPPPAGRAPNIAPTVAQAPTLEPVRRTAELVPGLGVGRPLCAQGRIASDRCEGIRTGLRLGITALWRVTPHLAWGGAIDLLGFAVDAPERLGLDRGGGGAVFLGLIGRYYFLDSGMLDPFVSLGIGGGALGTSVGETDASGQKARFEETVAGPAVRVGAGLDFFLSPSLRLGPQAAYVRVFTDRIRRCSAESHDDCVDRPTADYGHVDSFVELTVALTIQLGSEH